jgi:uncharacterized protein (TIGR02246 family)
MLRFQSWIFLLLILFFTSCGMQESGDEKAIRDKVKAYQTAFNEKKAAVLASMWMEDADYVNPVTGEEVNGREAIQKHFEEKFQKPESPKLELQVDSISFPKANEALEIGTATVKKEDQSVIKMAYKAHYEKVNGDWLISEVREVEDMDAPSHYDHLKELEWLVGSWVDQDEDTIVTTTYEWDRYKNFLLQHFSVAVEGKFQMEGKQIIGWDPLQNAIRSWIFDSDGGFGEAKWAKKGTNWVVETSQTLDDGRKASSTNIFTPINADSYKWESTEREVDGELLPEIEPVTIVRKGTAS